MDMTEAAPTFRPTPTQEENDRAALGEHILERETDDGNGEPELPPTEPGNGNGEPETEPPDEEAPEADPNGEHPITARRRRRT